METRGAPQTIHIILNMLSEFHSSYCSEIATSAQSTIDRIQTGEILIGISRSPGSLTSVTLNTEPFPVVNPRLFPVLAIDINQIPFVNPQLVKADLLRTMTILDQMPSFGYERRLRTVYVEALDTQRAWLDYLEIPENVYHLDPRNAGTYNYILAQLLSRQELFSDVGFEDFQQVLYDPIYRSTFSYIFQGNTTLAYLDRLKNDVKSFLLQRFFFHLIATELNVISSDSLGSIDEDTRAEITTWEMIISFLRKIEHQNRSN